VSAGAKLARQSRRHKDNRRYQLDGRRTTAEPLTASWQPITDDRADDRAEYGSEDGAEERTPVRSRRRGLFATYGWRVYAVPVLIVVTVLVLLNTSHQPSTGAGTSGVDAAGNGTPTVTEEQATSANAQSGTAVLPVGGAFPQAGAGTWRVLPGSGPIVGKGQVFHYQIAVEDGIDPSVYDGDDAFASTVDAILANPKSWIGSGTIALQRVDASYPNPDFVISLTTPNTDHRPDICGYQIPYESSCWRRSANRVVINVARWVRGALAFNGDLGLYREYAINHEVGHVFGNQHVGCTINGGLAPVMMQQTFGVDDDYVWQLNQTDPTNKFRVPQDGKACRVNAWPYPGGAGYQNGG
jgi:hypothetical protein